MLLLVRTALANACKETNAQNTLISMYLLSDTRTLSSILSITTSVELLMPTSAGHSYRTQPRSIALRSIALMLHFAPEVGMEELFPFVLTYLILRSPSALLEASLKNHTMWLSACN